MKIVKETQSLIVIKQGNPAFLAVLLLVFILSGFSIFYPLFSEHGLNLGVNIWVMVFNFLILLAIKFTTISFNKGFGKLFIVSKSILGKKIKEYHLSTIKSIKLLQVNREKGVSSEILAILESGAPVSLAGASGVVRVLGRQIVGQEKTIGQKIAVFLGIPFQEAGPMSFSEAVAHIKGSAAQF